MPLTVEQFTQRLTSSGVMSEDDLRNWIAAVPIEQRPSDGEALARELVKQKKLTKFQAEQIYAGKEKSLTLGNYVILDKLGQGGMGMVLKAQHKRMKRVVALKVMSPTAVKSADALKRFHREVEAAAKLTHPNIVAAFDADEAKGTHFLVMEYVEGDDLSALVKKHGPLPVEQAIRCIIQAARGLEFAHEQGVIHRDIKPANLLIDAKGNVKILDMGLARIEGAIGGSSEGSGLTNTGTIMGTVDYMPPEQAMDAKHADARSDTYSLGCSLYYLLTGKVVYDGDTMMKKLMAHQNAPIPELASGGCKPSESQSSVEQNSEGLHPPLAELQYVFRRMVAKRPEDRPQTMTQVIAELERCLSGGSPTAAFERSTNSVTASGASGSGNELQDFLKQISGEGGSTATSVAQSDSKGTAVTPSSAEAETMISSAGEGGTDPRTEQTLTLTRSGEPMSVSPRTVRGLTPSGSPSGRKKKTLLLGSLAAAVVVLLGIMFAIRGKSATLHLEIADELIEVTVGDKGRKLTGMKEHLVRVPLGELVLHIEREEIAFDTDSFEVTKGENVPIKVERVGRRVRAMQGKTLLGHKEGAKSAMGAAASVSGPTPPLAKAPFDANQARAHQEAWAKHLNMPVEKEFTLPGGEKLVMMLIPPGEFVREDGGQKFPVRLTKPFYLGKYEVTQEQWQGVMGTNPSQFKDSPTHPVELVSWDDIQPFLTKLNSGGSVGPWRFALPTEAQWEYACRAGMTQAYSSGDSADDLAQFAWFKDNSGGKTHPVGQLKPNPFGLYDVHGNVWEWCVDWKADGYYAKAPLEDPPGLSAGSLRVHRGGSWIDYAVHCGSAIRDAHSPAHPAYNLGIRLAASIDAVALDKFAETPPPNKTTGGDAPPSAKAPFDAQQARTHQEAWAKHLGVPVEYTNSIGMKFVLIPPGEFLMGGTPSEIAEGLKLASNKQLQDLLKSEAPQHRVILSEATYLGVNEVTQKEYLAVMGTNPSHFSSTGNGKAAVAGLDTQNHPVERVSWNDAVEFCAKLGEREKLKPGSVVAANTAKPNDGQGYRLPTEAEWEFACRAGTTSQFWLGDKEEDLLQIAWFERNSGERTHPVGQLKPNPFGLFDMHGNVWNWVQDGWELKYYEQFAQQPATNPRGPLPASASRVVRGGSRKDTASGCRSSNRGLNEMSGLYLSIGFRVSLSTDAVRELLKNERASTIDLLARIDPKQDRVSGVWERKGAEVVGRNEGFAVIEAPYRVPEEYDLTVEFTRHEVQGQVAVALSHAGKQFKWTLGNGTGADQFGFDAIGGKYVQSFPEAKHPELAMVSDRRYVTKVEVRRDRVIGYLDGKKLTELPTDYSNLSVGDFAKLRDNGLVGLVVASGAATFHRMELIEVTGKGTPTRAVAALPPAPKPAIAPFDAAQARAHQEAWAKHLGTDVVKPNTIGMQMTLIPPGEFLMGSSDADITLALKIAEETKLDEPAVKRIQEERPQHTVRITKPFRLAAHEVTIGQFAKFIEQAKYKTQAEEFGGNSAVTKTDDFSNPDNMKFNWRTPGEAFTDESPVTQVSWNDAVVFCNWLSDQEKLEPCYQRDGDTWALLPKANGYRLPTEAEWEYSCRAGTATQYSFGDDWKELDKYGWSNKNAGGRPRSVGLLPANSFGLRDMHGNVCEWCQDWYDGKWYEKSPSDDPLGPSRASFRVFRSSGWFSVPAISRSSSRYSHTPSHRYFDRGFRVALSSEGTLSSTTSVTTSTSPVVTPPSVAKPVGPAPPIAKAPFNAAQAKQHQESWAKHLGTTVETTNSVGAKMILIPPGEFLMGSTDEQVEAALKVVDEVKADQATKDRIQKAERPQHKVVITKPLLMGTTEVTIGQFNQFAAATNYQTELEKEGIKAQASPPPAATLDQPPPKPIQTYLNPGYVVTDDSPAAAITWNDAVAYCNWLCEKEQAKYRLPTEAEWEYACRAGTTTQYSFGDDHQQLKQYGWYDQNAGGRSHAVGTKLPNPFGLFDMHGNLQEWCGDFYDEKWYTASPPNDPGGPSVGSSRVLRGGNWHLIGSYCRSAYRNISTPSSRRYGFRVVRVLDAQAK